MILTNAIARLAEVSMPPLLSVEGAEQLAALAQGTAPQHGAAFVMPFEERAESNPLGVGAFRQSVSVDFLVAVVIRQHGDARGAARIQAADEFRIAIETALAGWMWNEDAVPAELVAARAAPAGNGVTWYVQTWRTDRWVEA